MHFLQYFCEHFKGLIKSIGQVLQGAHLLMKFNVLFASLIFRLSKKNIHLWVASSFASSVYVSHLRLEASFLGCFPLCPKRLVYPEIFPGESFVSAALLAGSSWHTKKGLDHNEGTTMSDVFKLPDCHSDFLVGASWELQLSCIAFCRCIFKLPWSLHAWKSWFAFFQCASRKKSSAF